jgi:hypothetical protein
MLSLTHTWGYIIKIVVAFFFGAVPVELLVLGLMETHARLRHEVVVPDAVFGRYAAAVRTPAP